MLVYIEADEACRALSISQLAFYCTLVISQMFIALEGAPIYDVEVEQMGERG